MPALRQLSRQDARRLAITRQHLDRSRRPAMLDVIRDLGCVQLDPIRHVARTHRLVLWSRLGSYRESALDRLRWQDRRLFEYWAHAASLVLTEELPVHYYRMRLFRDPKRSSWAKSRADWFAKRPDVIPPLLEEIVTTLKSEGPHLSRDIEGHRGEQSRWYNGRFVPRLLDYLWSRGEVMVVDRPGNQRLWGLADEFWPEWTPREQWETEQVTRFAAQKAIRALGVATPVQIKKHYTRNMYPKLGTVLRRLTAEQTLEKVTIIDKKEPLKGDWYIHSADIPLLEAIQAGQWRGRTVLLSPFDNLICDRDRTEQLWDFYYRIEIYVPKAKREYGYYVLPILHKDRLIGRIDAKMDRKQNIFQVNTVYAEAKAPKNKRMLRSLSGTITRLANFLEADAINFGEVPDGWQALPALTT